MTLQTDNKEYQKLAKNGSILKAMRCSKGGGKGLIAGGFVPLIFGALIALLFAAMDIMGGAIFMFVLLGVPGLIMIGIGIPMKNKRNAGWLEYYKKDTGFDEEELAQVDRELASPNVQIIGHVLSGGSKKHPVITCFITEHYFVTTNDYVRRINDILAAAFTTSTPKGADIFGLLCLTKQGEDVDFMTFSTASDKKMGLCMEVIKALYARNPRILRTERLACDGKLYNLKKDAKEIRRLCLEGHQVMEVVR